MSGVELGLRELRERVSEGMVRAIELLLMVLFLVSPLIISIRLKQVFNTPKYVLVGAVAVCLGCLMAVEAIFERRLRLPRNPGGWFLLAFLGWSGLSLLWSSDMAVASRDFGYHAAMVTIFLAAFLYGREEERVDNLLHFPIAAGVLAAGFGVLQYYQLDAPLLRGFAVGPLLFLSGILLAVGVGLREGTRPFQRPGLVLALLAGLAASFNDAAVQGLGLLITLLWFFLRSLSPQSSWLTLGLRLLSGLVALILSSLLDGQLMLFLGLVILLDEAGEAADEDVDVDVGPALLATGLLTLAITASMKGWDLSFLILPKKPTESVKVYSFMGHRNYLAGFLIAVIPLAVVRLISSWCVVPPEERDATVTRAWRVGVYLVAVLLMTVVLMLCHTRGAWIGCIASLGFLSVWILLRFMPLRPLGLLALVLGGVGLVASIWGWKRLDLPGVGRIENPFNRQHQSAGSRLAQTLDIQHGSAFQRALIYRTTWHIIFDHPINCLFGTGIGTFGLHYMPAQKEVLEQPGMEKYRPVINKSIYAHNEYWHYWSEVGLLGILLLFGAIYSIASAAHRRLRQEPPGAPALMFMGMVASLVATCVHNMFTFDFHLAYTGAFFYAVAGMVLAQSDPEFWVLEWGERRRVDVDSGDVRGELELVSLEGQVWARGMLEPADPDAALVLTAPSGAKRDQGPDAFGEFEVVLPEEVGTFKVELSQKGLQAPPLTLEAGESQDRGRVLLLQTGALLVTLGVCVVTVHSLANDILRDVHWRDGFLKFRARRFEEAFLDFERSVAADPTKGEVLFDFGRALMDSGRNEPAIKVFSQAKATFVDPANDHNIALCYYKMGNYEKAEEHYRSAIELNEIYEQSLANLSYLLIQQNRVEEALPLLERGLEIYPKNVSFPTSMAVALAQQQRFEEAKPYFDEALAMNPGKASVYINAGTVYYNLGLFEEAEAAYRKAEELKPEDPVVRKKMALLNLARWTQAAKDNPQDLETRRNYAAALLAAGHVGAAATEARNVLQAAPNDWVMRYTYGRALEHQGYAEDAMREYRRALEHAPASSGVAEDARERLEQLQAGEGGASGPAGPARPGGGAGN